jgi:outer membrane protein assembly factor BamD (BamD/ComL family)
VAEENKATLLSKFPESVYAKLLLNPNFIKELQDKEAAVGKLYETGYNSYLNGDYNTSLARSEEGISLYPNHKLTPKFYLLRALNKGKLGNDEDLRKELGNIIKDFPKSEEAGASKDIIAMMDVKHPEVKEAEEEVVAKEIYKPVDENEKHFFAMVVASKKANQNQLAFNLINYNLDNYSNSNLTVKADIIGPNQIVVVREFKSKAEALNYFDAAVKNSTITKDVGAGILATFVISEANLATLMKDGSESKYLKFFKNNYNR